MQKQIKNIGKKIWTKPIINETKISEITLQGNGWGPGGRPDKPGRGGPFAS